MSITSTLFPNEVCPGADCERIEFADSVPDPEDVPDPTTGLSGIDNFANSMRLLGPPPRGAINQEIARGEQVFNHITCNSCHVSSLRTAVNTISALNLKRFYPDGDFLLHDIGTGDKIRQSGASPDEIRTAPLWGVAFRAPFLHDGRASTLRQAIEFHGEEAARSQFLFKELSEEDKEVLIAFLESL